MVGSFIESIVRNQLIVIMNDLTATPCQSECIYTHSKTRTQGAEGQPKRSFAILFYNNKLANDSSPDKLANDSSPGTIEESTLFKFIVCGLPANA